MFKRAVISVLVLLSISISGSKSMKKDMNIQKWSISTCDQHGEGFKKENCLPEVASGRVAFYAAEYNPDTYEMIKEISIGKVNDLFPLASSYKGLLIEALMREVDNNRLSLNKKIKTTDENRSIEVYPAGVNTLDTLAERAIDLSDNTAADIIHSEIGARRFTLDTMQDSSKTKIFLSTKALWAAQGGFLKEILGEDTLAGIRQYYSLSDESKIEMARKLILESRKHSGPQIERALESYFKKYPNEPDIELALYGNSTAKEFSDLIAKVYSGNRLKPETKKRYRSIMSKGCCQAESPSFKYKYWAAKAGSAWRILTMTGYVELENGRILAYSYFNDKSAVRDSIDIERQIRPVANWIDKNLRLIIETNS